MDRQLQRLLRAWTASGALEDQWRYLRARFRKGQDAHFESLQVAIWLGDETAREFSAELFGDDALTLVGPKTGVSKLLFGLPGSHAVQLRAARAAFRTALELRAYPNGLQEAFEAVGSQAERPTPEQESLARSAVGVLQGLSDSGVLSEDRMLEALLCYGRLVLDEWTDGDRYTVMWVTSEACRSKAERQRMRDAVVADLLPWVFMREVTDREGAGPAPVIRTLLFAKEHMSTKTARAVLALTPKARPNSGEAQKLIEAYLKSTGWRRARASFLNSAGDLRIKVKPRSLRVESGGPGNWSRIEEHVGKQISVIEVAQRLIQQAREVT